MGCRYTVLGRKNDKGSTLIEYKVDSFSKVYGLDTLDWEKLNKLGLVFIMQLFKGAPIQVIKTWSARELFPLYGKSGAKRRQNSETKLKQITRKVKYKQGKGVGTGFQLWVQKRRQYTLCPSGKQHKKA